MRIGRSLSTPWDSCVGSFDDILWAFGEGVIRVFDPAGGQTDVAIPPGTQPASAEAIGDEVWFGVFEGEAVRIDHRDLTTRPAPVPHARRFAPFDGTIWAVDEDQNALVEIEPNAGSSEVRLKPKRAEPLSLRSTTDHGIWLRCGNGSIVYFPATDTSIEIPASSPFSLTEEDGFLVAATDHEVLLIDVASRTAAARIAMTAASEIVPHGSALWIAGQSGLCALDRSNLADRERWLLNNGVHNLAFVAGRVWAASWEPPPGAHQPRPGRRPPGRVFSFDHDGGPLVSFDVSASPVLQTVGDELTALHRDNPGSLTRFDTTSPSVHSTLAVGMFPHKIVAAFGSAWLTYAESFGVDELLTTEG